MVGARFLDDSRRVPIKLGGRAIHFRKSCNPPRPDVLDRISRSRFAGLTILEDEVAIEKDLTGSSNVSSLQFGWECRDEAFSVEFEIRPLWTARHRAEFSQERRELVVYLTAEKTGIVGGATSVEETRTSIGDTDMSPRMPTTGISTPIRRKSANMTSPAPGKESIINRIMTDNSGSQGRRSTSRNYETLELGFPLTIDFDKVRRISKGIGLSNSVDRDYSDFRYDYDDSAHVESIVISFSQIDAAYWSEGPDSPVVYLMLRIPPSFIRHVEEYTDEFELREVKERLSSLSVEGHSSVSPFVSTSMRLVFADSSELQKFRRHWALLKLKLELVPYDSVVVQRNLFSSILL